MKCRHRLLSSSLVTFSVVIQLVAFGCSRVATLEHRTAHGVCQNMHECHGELIKFFEQRNVYHQIHCRKVKLTVYSHHRTTGMGVAVVRNKTNDIKIDFPWHSLNHILFADYDVILR